MPTKKTTTPSVKLYVGLKPYERVLFRAPGKATAGTHPGYLRVIGPFRTLAAAELLRDEGGPPNLETVAQAERVIRERTKRLEAQAVAELRASLHKANTRIGDLERTLREIRHSLAVVCRDHSIKPAEKA